MLPERLDRLPLVNRFESLAGAHPHDDIVVRLPEPAVLDLEPADGGSPILFVPRQPVQIAGRYYTLVRYKWKAAGAPGHATGAMARCAGRRRAR